jgi:catechol 2,3-dioxygenase-like lactoylglutathione lyase family enzyme
MTDLLKSAAPPILGRRMQLSMVVNDIDAAAHLWSDTLGVGPWILFENAMEGRRFVHRGQDSQVGMSLAMAYGGETQFELIQQTNDEPSPYREFLDAGREGVQHIEFWPDDYSASSAALQQGGFEEVSVIYNPDGTKNGSYFVSPSSVGVVVAIIPMTPFRQSYMSVIEYLAATWDGTRPLRKYSTRAEFIASQDFVNAQAALTLR